MEVTKFISKHAAINWTKSISNLLMTAMPSASIHSPTTDNGRADVGGLAV